MCLHIGICIFGMIMGYVVPKKIKNSPLEKVKPGVTPTWNNYLKFKLRNIDQTLIPLQNKIKHN